MPNRVLVLSASIGMGHVRAGKAIEHALSELNSEISVRHEDALQYANVPFRKLYQKTYAELVDKAPELLGWLYDYSDKGSTTSHGIAFERFNSIRLIKLVEEQKPNAIVCTHQLRADMISWLICKGRYAAQHAVVITDFDINPMWLCHHYSRYFVALQETKEHMVALGYERERILVSGIPIDSKFAIAKDKHEMRVKHGLAVDRPII